MKIVRRIIPALLILALGFWGYQHFIPSSDETNAAAKKRTPRRARAPQQTTSITLTPTDYTIQLQSQGSVRARTSTSLTPLVAGRIIHITDLFQDGAFFKQGDTLIQLDPTDFHSQITIALATLARAESSLAQEQARAAQALRNWKDIGFDEKPNDLVLRVPQLKEARANVAAQQAALDRAKRNLSHATITAPFDGRVRSRDAGPGQSVGTGTKLGEIYATDFAEVRLPLSAHQLTQIDIDEQGNQAIHVQLTDALNSSSKTTWTATIKHVEGELDETSRELFVIAHIHDPFGITTANPPIRINQPVLASITANTLRDVIIIDRKHLYGSNEILLIEDGKILRTPVKILWSTPDTIIVSSAQLAGKTLATTRLPYAHTGTPVTQQLQAKITTKKKHPAKKDNKSPR